MLKLTKSPDKPAPSRNNSNKPTFGRNDSNSENDEFGGNGVKYSKKSEKMKSQNLVKVRKSSKLRKSKGEKPKKLSKSGNSPNFSATKVGPSFLTPKAKAAFNC